MLRSLRLALVLVLCGCPVARPSVRPHPQAVPDTALCAAMCAHIGPKGLNCEEGQPVYDSDKPGPTDVPNVTCEDFCKDQQANGVFINPRCVMKVSACSEIEVARQKVCP